MIEEQENELIELENKIHELVKEYNVKSKQYRNLVRMAYIVADFTEHFKEDEDIPEDWEPEWSCGSLSLKLLKHGVGFNLSIANV